MFIFADNKFCREELKRYLCTANTKYKLINKISNGNKNQITKTWP